MTTQAMNETGQRIKELEVRVINGNQALWDAWQRAKAAADNELKYIKIVHAIDSKFLLLDTLCRALMALGYNKCLYTDNRPCFTQDGWFCFVCPKSSLPESSHSVSDSLAAGDNHPAASPDQGKLEV